MFDAWDDDARRAHAWSWLREHRFGVFLHWGVYALAARHEWVRYRERLDDDAYQRYVDHFDPDLFDADAWAAAVEGAGASFGVLTTKHHDGFCLWPSAAGDYTVAQTPFGATGRDIVREYVDAFRAHGLGAGLYHSLLDWHHPDFAIDGFHPQRAEPDVAERNAGRTGADYRSYLHAQLRELLDGYGDVPVLFADFTYDGGYPSDEGPVWGGKGAEDWGSPELLTMLRELQPTMLVNDRLGIGAGDFLTPEQYQPAGPMTADGEPRPWLACQTIDGSWGYDRDNRAVKSPDLVLRMLIDTVSKDGSFLLNVGPDGRGRFDADARRVLAEIGGWMDLHRRSIDGAGAAPWTPPADARYTRRGDRLYLHLFAWPYGAVHLPGLAGKVRYAQLLDDASEIRMSVTDPDAPAFTIFEGGQPAGTLTLHLPTVPPDVLVPVVELVLEED